MKKVTIIPSQQQAIEVQGRNVLMSASAGSGKTFVVVERIMANIRKGMSIEEMLISTFSRKAAQELIERLEKKLQGHKLPEFQQALQNLPLAYISTLDAFANKLVQEHFNRIGIDPSYSVMSESAESTLLLNEVLDTVIVNALKDKTYKSKFDASSFKKLANNFSSDRNINGFKDAVIELYYFVSSTPDPIEWLEKDMIKGFDADGTSTLAATAEQALGALELINESIGSLLGNGELGKATATKAETFLSTFDNLKSPLVNHDYEAFQIAFKSLLDNKIFDRWILKDFPEVKAEFDQAIGTKTAPGLSRVLASNIQKQIIIDNHTESMKELATVFQQFMLVFYKAVLKRKAGSSRYEFHDIMHFAIKILAENPDLREDYRRHFKEIIIDEYQDTNQAQERLLGLLGTGSNLYMVGDVKQSIYGFRQADPSLFVGKYNAFDNAEHYKPKSEGELILLKENFRSRPEVLSFTNELFARLMDERFGGIKYSEEALVYGGDKSVTTDEAYYPELLLYHQETEAPTVDEDKSDNESSEVSNQDMSTSSGKEVEIAAQRIRELIVFGVQPKDIAVLVRTKSQNNLIEDCFKQYHIPVFLTEGRVEYLKALEVLLMVDVLRAIDNPFYDIPLVATLRSPLFNFNEDELTRIVTVSTTGSATASSKADVKSVTSCYWEHILAIYNQTAKRSGIVTDELEGKVKDFYDTFSNWRAIRKQLPLDELLEVIYQDSYYFDYVGSLPDGEKRQMNLRVLSEKAQSFESSGYKGLSRFVRMIETIMSQQNDLANEVVDIDDNAVQVMTIHKSKGIEFEHVFVMNLQSKFNLTNSSKLNVTNDYGVGFSYTANVAEEVESEFPFALLTMPTNSFNLNKDVIRQAEISEEMRVLYVALTRAKTQLHLVGKVKDTKNKLWYESYEDVSFDEDGMLPLAVRTSGSGYLNWILACYYASGKTLPVKVVEVDETQVRTEANALSKTSRAFAQISEQAKQVSTDVYNVTDALSEAQDILTHCYDHKSATQTQALQTPSSAVAIEGEEITFKDWSIDLSEMAMVTEVNDDNGVSGNNVVLSRAEIGTLIHAILLAMPLDEMNLLNIEMTVADTVARVVGDDTDKIPNLKVLTNNLISFFNTELGDLVIDNYRQVHREENFTMLKQEESGDGQSDDAVLIRGIMDGYIVLNNEVILFDYKTDHLNDRSHKSTTEGLARIKQQHKAQLALYAKALSSYYGLPVTHQYLVLLGGQRAAYVVDC